jgi:hypothetical protein
MTAFDRVPVTTTEPLEPNGDYYLRVSMQTSPKRTFSWPWTGDAASGRAEFTSTLIMLFRSTRPTILQGTAPPAARQSPPPAGGQLFARRHSCGLFWLAGRTSEIARRS